MTQNNHSLLYWAVKYFFVFIGSLFLGLVFTFLVKKLALRIGILDQPSERKIHQRPIPLWGGLAVYLAYCIPILAFAFKEAVNMKSLLFGGLPVLLIGLLDDIKPVSGMIKFILLIILTAWLSKYGIIVKISGFYPLNLLVTVLWIVGITSAFNAIDNMDGLACGVSGIIALLFFIVALTSRQWSFGLLSCAIGGAVLGFSPFNFYPAKIFLGNGGSLFLGFTLGTIAIMGVWSSNPVIAYAIPLLIMAIPIFDIVYVVLLRYKEGLTPSIKEIIDYCGKDHLSHRLMALGLGQRQVVVLLYLLSFCLGLGAITLKVELNQYDAAILMVQAFLIILIIGVLLNIKGNVQR